MTEAAGFDFAALHEDIVVAAMAAFAEISASQSDDPVRAFALYSDSGAMTVCPAMATADYLRRIDSEYPGERLYYRYSPSEWPLEGVGADEQFGRLCDRLREHVFALEARDGGAAFADFKARLMDTLVESAESLRKQCFAGLGEDFVVLATISDDDEPAAELNRRVARLNSPAIAAEFAAWSSGWRD
ncbi:DUF4303 domain-containing protein [Lysobacter sp. 22409]|uniref:DUF4303 domain-containing protein n=1 Tax=Lysobacter sp. 22409 TaxID=3453917 RepID=UPI003F83F793